jgi:hypothetical protein
LLTARVLGSVFFCPVLIFLRRSSMPFALLGDPESYLFEIAKLKTRAERRSWANSALADGFGLVQLGPSQERELAKVLASTVADGQYVFEPVEPCRALIHDKWRNLYRAVLTDTIVLGVLARVLAARLESFFSPRLFSYRQGRSPWLAIATWVDFLREHRCDHRDKKSRGLYVLRRDIRSYGESIPVDDRSALWELLREGLGQPVPDYLWPLLRGALRPLVRGGREKAAPLECGLPTGSPIQPVIGNLYLTPIDRQFDSAVGGFYARFGDDILFAHPCASLARQTAQQLDHSIGSLGLEINASKRQDIYFTGPGRPSLQWPHARPLGHVEYLGCRVDFSGALGLKSAKHRRFLLDLRRRLRQSTRLLGDLSFEERARALCAIVNTACDPTCPVADPAAAHLRFVIDDRAELAQLDYALALELAQLLCGGHGPRAFRSVSYHSLRHRFGLKSLVQARAGRRHESA